MASCRSLTLAPLCFAAMASGAAVEVGGSSVKVRDESSVRKGPVMEGSTPQLSEEDSLSKDIPTRHRCNACKAFVFQLNEHFRPLGKRSLKNWEVEEIYETVCEGRNTVWQKYGARDIDGVPQLTGPGLWTPAPQNGQVAVASTGGIWADRLAMACLQAVDSIGEEELYKLYTRSGTYDGLDEFHICVQRRKLCQEDELEGINSQIAEQKLLDAGRNTRTADSRSGFQTDEGKRVTKPAEPRGGKGKTAETARPPATTTKKTTIATTTTSITLSSAPSATADLDAGSERRQRLIDEISRGVHGLRDASLEKVLSYVKLIQMETETTDVKADL